MIGYNSQVGEGKYHIQVETDNRDYYRAIEDFIRIFVDLANSGYDKYDYMVEELPTYGELVKENKVYIPGEMIIAKDYFLEGRNFLKLGDGKSKYCDLPFVQEFVCESKRTEKELANILRMYSGDRLRELRKDKE